ncbi:hypothetical protein EJ08DRAFT_152818 [Tothia fuscella]|uniref:Uncharacterized protein n=1 Tax=Tothia fuscella TaxID=1048955 RepID=A0A9P4P4W3_9PEZI|nr:hypothetical protein EJ08DRAFT_152818 [Tothia fuscella]
MMLPERVDFLILGAGWTSKFLIPVLESSKTPYAATTTTGHDGTISFKFDPESDETSPYKALPHANTILITFPLRGKGQSEHLVKLYSKVHPIESGKATPNWIQLGSTGIFTAAHWNTCNSPYDKENTRAIAEDELLGLSSVNSTVLNLAGLYDDDVRKPRNWVDRVAKNKHDVGGKLALHLIHGIDVARAILNVHQKFPAVQGRRWLLTDMFVYDWWSLIMDWGGTLMDGETYRRAVWLCMQETYTEALPRSVEKLGRVLDSRDFWGAIGILPEQGRVK